MDAGSIFSNALGGLLGGLALLLLVELGKRIQTTLKRRGPRPKEVFNEALRGSQEYQQILSNRRFYLMIGYMFLVASFIFLAAFVSVSIQTGKINVDSTWIVPFLLFLSEVPFALYIGYAPISSPEIKQKRQRERERIFKQAQGARPYGYIFFSIIFPIIFWFYVILCFIVFALFLVFPSPFHISMFWVVGGIVIIILISLGFTYFLAKMVYRAIKYLRYLPLEKREELRQQFMNNELEQ